jgi:AcrR family transcriptional regulator
MASADVRAPSRGRYNRAQSREARQAEQHERLLQATCLAVARGSVNVSSIVDAAGVGRNTFYEYFDDAEHALDAVRQRAETSLAQHFAAASPARTPVERVRALARCWLEAVDAQRSLIAAALQPGFPGTDAYGLSSAARVLLRELQRLAEHSAVSAALPGAADPDHLAALAAAFGVVTRRYVTRDPPNREAAQRLLVDLSLRILR